MWRWLFDRVCRKESRFAASDPRKNGEKRSKTVLYAKVNLNLQLESVNDNSVAENTASTLSDPHACDSIVAIKSGTLPPNHQDPGRAALAKKRKIRILRFMRRFEEMTRVEAKLLFAIHRRTVRGLAKESPAGLQRDLHRFILSSRGQRISDGQPAPNIQKVRAWIEAARQHTSVC